MDVPLLTLNKLNTLHVFKIMYIRRGNDGLNAFMNELQQMLQFFQKNLLTNPVHLCIIA